MFFRRKACEDCTKTGNENKLLKDEITKARNEILRLEKLVASLQCDNDSSAAKEHPESEVTAVASNIDAHAEREERRQKASRAYGYVNANITLRDEVIEQPAQAKRFATSSKLASKGEMNVLGDESVQKFKMTDDQKARLVEKRRDLKERLGEKKRLERSEQIKGIVVACEKHFSKLSRNLKQRLVYDDYGSLQMDGRLIECSHFLKSLQLDYSSLSDQEAVELVLSTIAKLENEQTEDGFSVNDYPEDGWEFELWVAESLARFGWQARATKGSGDQGVDVVAIKDGVSLGVQCKRYSGAVGNKAVQEAFSGAKHMGLDKAAVLTNADFTRSAKDLAGSTGVLLLSPEDIPTLADRMDMKT